MADAAPEDPEFEAARGAVHAWSDALDRHDLKALANMYLECVFFYAGDGSGCVPRSSVLQVKRAALGPHSTFRQDIVGDIEVLHEKWGPRLVARFLKRSGAEGKSSEVRARLVMWRGRDDRFFRSSSKVGVADRASPRPEPGAALALGTPDTIPSCGRRDGRVV